MCDKENFDKLVEFIQGSNDKQTKELKAHIDKEIAEIRREVNEEREKRIELEEEHKKLKEKYDVLEKSLRKNNIVIFGINNRREESLLDTTLEILNTHLNLGLNGHDINNIYRIGKENGNKPILVKFVSFLTKLKVLKSAKRLKGTSISIVEDLNLEERKIHKILRPHLREARTKGLTAYIKNNRLIINNEAFNAEQLVQAERDSENEETTSVNDPNTETRVKPHLLKEINEPHPSTSVKKRSNDVNKEVAELDPKKRKIGAITSNHRSSPRFNEKEVQSKTK